MRTSIVSDRLFRKQVDLGDWVPRGKDGLAWSFDMSQGEPADAVARGAIREVVPAGCTPQNAVVTLPNPAFQCFDDMYKLIVTYEMPEREGTP